MKKIISLVLIIAVVVAGIVFVPKLVHTCDDCEKFFIGAGYEPNIVADLLKEGDQVICEDCAKEQHALAIALGKDVEEFKKELF